MAVSTAAATIAIGVSVSILIACSILMVCPYSRKASACGSRSTLQMACCRPAIAVCMCDNGAASCALVLRLALTPGSRRAVVRKHYRSRACMQRQRDGGSTCGCVAAVMHAERCRSRMLQLRGGLAAGVLWLQVSAPADPAGCDGHAAEQRCGECCRATRGPVSRLPDLLPDECPSIAHLLGVRRTAVGRDRRLVCGASRARGNADEPRRLGRPRHTEVRAVHLPKSRVAVDVCRLQLHSRARKGAGNSEGFQRLRDPAEAARKRLGLPSQGLTAERRAAAGGAGALGRASSGLPRVDITCCARAAAAVLLDLSGVHLRQPLCRRTRAQARPAAVSDVPIGDFGRRSALFAQRRPRPAACAGSSARMSGVVVLGMSRVAEGQDCDQALTCRCHRDTGLATRSGVASVLARSKTVTARVAPPAGMPSQ